MEDHDSLFTSGFHAVHIRLLIQLAVDQWCVDLRFPIVCLIEGRRKRVGSLLLVCANQKYPLHERTCIFQTPRHGSPRPIADMTTFPSSTQR